MDGVRIELGSRSGIGGERVQTREGTFFRVSHLNGQFECSLRQASMKAVRNPGWVRFSAVSGDA